MVQVESTLGAALATKAIRYCNTTGGSLIGGWTFPLFGKGSQGPVPLLEYSVAGSPGGGRRTTSKIASESAFLRSSCGRPRSSCSDTATAA